MIPPELSRPIALDRIGIKEKKYAIEPDAAERAALAKRLGIPEVTRMSATVALKLTRGGKIVRLKGQVTADLVQICVVTLEPMSTRIDEEFTRLFTVDPALEATEIVIDPENEDFPDPVVDGQIDMGEAAAEHLALAMDPFPRKPDAAFSQLPDPVPDEPARPNPFQALADQRDKKKR